ncbi:manganese/zinc/iron transport system permease protein [Bowdeniella nasicola]|uniref:Manganese/zinc/iron transport system permease protein n=2 Tax=Bowdeniella nasicola TaxID=208480 RepID=A0A1H3YAY2_9ACTO|nr:manganese/zinc/iron transport system permease protein [Bowdeniella nasicola]
MSFAMTVFVLALATALMCALPGTFLVLRRQSMLVDAMSHAALPGIVLAALVLGSINSPFLILGAGAAAMLVVFGAQWLRSTGRITGDADQALIFPGLFSVGIILISTRFAKVHLHEDAVIVGDLNFAAFDLTYLRLLLGVLALNALFLLISYRPLAAATFDEGYARTRGVATSALNYALMALVALTVVAAFNAAGAVLVVALMIVPPATALLIARTVPQMLAISLVIAAASAAAGFWLAYVTDAATSATMAAVQGAIFVLAWGALRIVRLRTHCATYNSDQRGARST